MIDRARELGSDRLPGTAHCLSNRNAWKRSVPLANTNAELDLWREAIGPLVANDLQAVQTMIKEGLSSRFAEVDRLCSAAAPGAGKKLRPVLTILTSFACNPAGVKKNATRKQQRNLHLCAAAVELVHAASLVHDDVMDGAETRRHRATVQSVSTASAAVLVGDFLFTKAYDFAAQCRNRYPARCIAKAASKLCEGELLQQSGTHEWSMSLKQYRRLLALKTGALCACSVRLGAWHAGVRSAEESRALARFGTQLGVAFQLQDDWLDYWGTECVGKTLGTDLQQAKPTLPLLRFLSQLAPNTRRDFECELSQPTRSEADHRNWVLQCLEQSDASEFTLAAAEKCARSAINNLDSLTESPYRDALQRIALASVRRSL